MEVNFCLESLADHRSVAAELVDLLHEEWGALPPWSTRSLIEHRLAASCRTSGVPFTYVALAQSGRPLGCASVKLRELADHPDKEHWLGEVFIRRERRGQGIGSALIAHCVSRSAQLGIAALYLYTPDRQALYRRFGWADHQRAEVNGEPVTIMLLQLANRPAVAADAPPPSAGAA